MRMAFANTLLLPLTVKSLSVSLKLKCTVEKLERFRRHSFASRLGKRSSWSILESISSNGDRKKHLSADFSVEAENCFTHLVSNFSVLSIVLCTAEASSKHSLLRTLSPALGTKMTSSCLAPSKGKYTEALLMSSLDWISLNMN